MIYKGLKIVATWLLLLLTVWLIGVFIYATAIPYPHDIRGNYDAIIVLTGGQGRIDYGASLVHKVAPVVFITGVSDDYTYRELKKVDGNQSIIYGNKALNTIGNAYETREWLDEMKAKGISMHNLLIVTANYHMPRTKMIFDHLMTEYTLEYAPVEPDKFQQGRWMSHANSLRLMLSEYHKYLITWISLKIFNYDGMSSGFSW